ncbi:MAG: hypothetical protein ABIP68_03215, partial [Ferruginibacter sp.]
FWIYFVSGVFGKTHYYDKPLIYYRRHGANASNASEKTDNSLFRIFRIRTTLIINLLKRSIKVISVKPLVFNK